MIQPVRNAGGKANLSQFVLKSGWICGWGGVQQLPTVSTMSQHGLPQQKENNFIPCAPN